MPRDAHPDEVDLELSNYIFTGCFCCYNGYDARNMVWGCVETCDCLFLRYSYCCACRAGHRQCGVTCDEGAGECVKLGCYCLDVGVLQPSSWVWCANTCQCCCCYRVMALPGSPYYSDTAVLAVACLAVAPKIGCCMSHPMAPALLELREGNLTYRVEKNEQMDR